MTTNDPPYESFLKDERKQSLIPGGLVYRLVLPVLYAALGVSLGSMTGLGVAIWSSQAGASWPSIPSIRVEAYAEPSPDSAPASPAQERPAIVVQASGASQPAAVAIPVQTVESAPRAGKVDQASSPARSTDAGMQTSPVPAAQQTHLRIARKSRHELRTIAYRVHQETRRQETRLNRKSAPTVSSMSMHTLDEQLRRYGHAASYDFYSEGDFTVVDYNAQAGTIETSDGRTFAVGATVAASNAVSWNDTNVHYRCSQSGSCKLLRAGAVAPNARLI